MRQAHSLEELRADSERHLTQFTDPVAHYAFRTYDQSSVHSGPLTVADVLMANLLSLKLSWREVTPLFADGDTPHTQLRARLDEALTECRTLPPLEECTDDQVEMRALRTANEATDSVDNWTAVTVSKVLHRLVPVVPLIDSRVKAFFGTKSAGEVRRRMRDDLRANAAWLAPLAARYPVRGQPLALTRVADILIWMGANRLQRSTPGISTDLG